MSAELASYCLGHGISMNWLITGELLDLQQMLQARRMGKAAAKPESFREKLAQLSEAQIEVIDMIMDHLMAKQP
ncbi:hypothetical protein [Bradyrhizobium sp. CCGUVB23]|uniref:hypothetical protein n=1 Tax=Bradyrhizobium sp. CCGUVB23 TaxID=2949630 RepID=UPI0020B2C201|nr:hypothetical protein [Bradyrhizobium sp. CCGUVB23]MCP3460382.1 hypothetical protein [Bradyrhizobium sp. CCGUVB23]